MNGCGLVFHHLGLAVRSAEKARRFLAALGYQLGDTMRDEEQNVLLSLCTHPSMPAVEVVSPTETAGPLAAMLQRNAELVYHLCWEVDDAELALSAIRRAVGAVRCVVPSKPAVLFGGRRVSFHMVAGVGLVELLDRRNGEELRS